MESISALSDEHPATALLLGSPSGRNSTGGARRTSSGAGSMELPAGTAASPAGVSDGVLSPAGSGGVGGAKLSPQQDFDASLDHAMDVMLTEVRFVWPWTAVEHSARVICASQMVHWIGMRPSHCCQAGSMQHWKK